MPQHVNARSFVPGDPRAAAAGRKGGRHRRARVARTPDYIAGYRAAARNARRHIHRWIQETQMAHFEKPAHSPFIKASIRLHRAQLDARTTSEREAADAALSHLLRMAGAGRFEEWQAGHDTDYDDSMAANAEEAS